MIPLRPTPPHLKRYGWFRVYNDFTRHPKWRAIAATVGLPLHEIIAVAMEILRTANVGRPRGSLAEFSPLECAAALDMPADHVARIYVAMETHGWIDNDYVVTWDERQPDKEDPTAAERQRRRRAKIRQQRLLEHPPPPPEELAIKLERLRNQAVERTRKYRAVRAERGFGADINAETYLPLLIARDGERCIYCCRIIDLAIDHIFPLSRGGFDHIDNFGLACRGCNGGKKDRTPEEADMPILVATAAAAYERFRARLSTGCHGVTRVTESDMSPPSRKMSPVSPPRDDLRDAAGDMSPAVTGDVAPVPPATSPDVASARERKRRRDRLRMRAKRAKAKSPEARHGVISVTSRPDQTRSDQPVSEAKPVDCVNWEENAAAWLAADGLETVRYHGKMLVSQAQIRIGRWRAAMGDDEALRDLIHSSAALAADGRFLNLVGEGVARHVRERSTGAMLPLPPVPLRRESG